MPASMYAQFGTDADFERKGVVVNYSDLFRVTLARAGGANKKYARVLEAKTRHLRRAIETETLDNDTALDILRETYAEAVVLNWEVNANRDDKTKDPEWVQGIEDPNGEVIPFSTENLLTTFRQLPELFGDIQQQAAKATLFRKAVDEEDAKN